MACIRRYDVDVELDPVASNPEHYRVLFENDRVRVLSYMDVPGDRTVPHRHPDSVMVTLTSFRRLLSADGQEREVELPAGVANWLPAQEHSGHNIGDTETRTIFVELKEPGPGPAEGTALGPE